MKRCWRWEITTGARHFFRGRGSWKRHVRVILSFVAKIQEAKFFWWWSLMVLWPSAWMDILSHVTIDLIRNYHQIQRKQPLCLRLIRDIYFVEQMLTLNLWGQKEVGWLMFQPTERAVSCHLGKHTQGLKTKSPVAYYHLIERSAKSTVEQNFSFKNCKLLFQLASRRSWLLKTC